MKGCCAASDAANSRDRLNATKCEVLALFERGHLA